MFVGQFKLMTEMFHITHSALHIGLTTTLQHYNSIYRSDMSNIHSALETRFSFALNLIYKFMVYPGVKTCEVFLCFVAVVKVRFNYVDFFVFFVLRHW